MAIDIDTEIHPCPFEGPEKLLEIWFAPSAQHVYNDFVASRPQGVDVKNVEEGKYGLRAVDRRVWDEMLDIVKCKVLSVLYGTEMDAYLLSESSLFISPHLLILKTCGTTLNLLGLPRILNIAATHSDPPLPKVHRCFYSRKAFMFPERQLGPHREWGMEVQFLDNIFKKNGGSAYTVGRVNGDHWLLYMSNPDPDIERNSTEFASRSGSCTELNSLASSIDGGLSITDAQSDSDADGVVAASANSLQPGLGSLLPPLPPAQQDHTIEILMTHLSARARAAFFTPASVCCGEPGPTMPSDDEALSSYAQKLSDDLGISTIFPRKHTTLDAYSFTPCGYSSNALIEFGDTDGQQESGEGYYTIHVTPEEGWSYASFECNVPLSTDRHRHRQDQNGGEDNIPDLHTLIQRVVRIFEPGKITLTLFVSSDEDAGASDGHGDHVEVEEETSECAVDAAQRVFKAALTRAVRPHKAKNQTGIPAPDSSVDRLAYKRTDKINYEFGGYELAYASFELM